MTTEDYAYECPDCGEGHDGMTTGTEYCEDCQEERTRKQVKK